MENIGFIYALGAAITWGLVYAIDQEILNGISPLMLTFISSLITIVILLPFIVYQGEGISLIFNKRNFLLTVTAAILAAFASFLILSGIKALGASTASIIEISYPFFVIIFSYIFFKSTPNLYFYLGGSLIFIGTIVIIKLA